MCVPGAGGVVGGLVGGGGAAGQGLLDRTAAVGPGLVVQAHAVLSAALTLGSARGAVQSWETNHERQTTGSDADQHLHRQQQ